MTSRDPNNTVRACLLPSATLDSVFPSNWGEGNQQLSAHLITRYEQERESFSLPLTTQGPREGWRLARLGSNAHPKPITVGRAIGNYDWPGFVP